MTKETYEANLWDPRRWGLPPEAVADLAEGLQRVWSRFRHCLKTQTRDTSQYAWVYLRGLLTMPQKRNFANIARQVIDPADDGQALQQFMSDSPWSAQAIFGQIQQDIRQRPALAGGMLTLDESGDERAGDQSAGAARQYLGRLGKVEMGQVGVVLGYVQHRVWAMVDADLYLPEVWLDADHAQLRRRWHIPEERAQQYLTKPQLGLALLLRAQVRGLPFQVVGCDSLYGRDSQFRAALDGAGLTYMADIPVDTQVYLQRPVVGIPDTPPGKVGRPFCRPRVLNGVQPVEARTLVAAPDFPLQRVSIRHTERGRLTYACAARRVWTLTADRQVLEEWLFIRREPDDSFSFSLSNAPADTPLGLLAQWRCLRYFAERIFQDAKSEGGWDELVARKYRSWMHHTALDALALWFIAETKLDWEQAHPRDPELKCQLEVEELPALSMANVRELLQAVLPLKQLSPEEATRLVLKHLVHRSRSTRSRLKAQRHNRSPT